MFENLPELENYLQEDTKMALIYIVRYICCKDKRIDDTFFYYQKYGSFLKNADRVGLKIPGGMVCKWIFYRYVFHEVDVPWSTCRTSLCNLLMMISESRNLNMAGNHGNHSYLYSPQSETEPKQKILKLSAD